MKGYVIEMEDPTKANKDLRHLLCTGQKCNSFPCF